MSVALWCYLKTYQGCGPEPTETKSPCAPQAVPTMGTPRPGLVRPAVARGQPDLLATTQPPSSPWVIKASSGTPCAQLHVLLAGWKTHTVCAHAHTYQECVYLVSQYFKHLSRTHKHSDTVTQPSVIDSVCAARPLFFLGDAITALSAYTKGSADMCVSVRVLMCAGDPYRTHLSLSQLYRPHSRSWLCMFVNRLKSSMCCWSICVSTVQECVFTARTMGLGMHDIYQAYKLSTLHCEMYFMDYWPTCYGELYNYSIDPLAHGVYLLKLSVNRVEE